MTLPRVVHLVDDTTAGGVMRVLDHITTSPDLAMSAHHSLICIDRGRVFIDHIKADIIVSHLAISWRAMPMLVALCVRHPMTPLVHVEHSYTEAFVAANVTHKRRFAALLRMAYGLFKRVVAVSEAQGKWLVRSGAVKSGSLDIIPSCVNLEAFRALAPVQSPVRVIGAIGRLDRQKGFDTLIKAFRNISNPDIRLQIHGQGAEIDMLRDLAGDDARIRFMGFASDPVSIFQSVDVVAMPSRWEAYGLVAIEALSAGRGLLVNPVDGLTDHIHYGAKVTEDTSVQAWQAMLEHQFAADQGPSISTLTSESTFEQTFSDRWSSLLSRLLPGFSLV